MSVRAVHTHLSKSRYLKGLKCLKRLYLDAYRPDLRSKVPGIQQSLMKMGTRVGEVARQRFAGGRLVHEKFWDHEAAVETTKELIKDTTVPAIFEAAFTYKNVRARVDILVKDKKQKDAFQLIEVKSSTKPKPFHFTHDLALQLYVLQGVGLNITNGYLLTVNKKYKYEGGEHDLEELFELHEMDAKAIMDGRPKLKRKVHGMNAALSSKTEPRVGTGNHCLKPFKCEFYEHCHRDQPKQGFPLSQLPGRNAKIIAELQNLNVTDIADIPSDFKGLNKFQQRVRDSVASRTPWVNPNLGHVMRSSISYPVSFVDFEVSQSAVPVYADTRAYENVPFQWSMHIREANPATEPLGAQTHKEFLDSGDSDPRVAFVESLLAAVPPTGSVLIYSSFEKTVLRSLAARHPGYAPAVEALMDRMVDLLAVVKNNYYHYDQRGSYSIKNVLPVLAPGHDYNDLEIQNGLAAVTDFGEMLDPKTEGGRRAEIRRALLDYCCRDTEAMVRVFDALYHLGH